MEKTIVSPAIEKKVEELNSKLNWRTLYSNSTFRDDVAREIDINLTGINLLDILMFDTSIASTNRFHLLIPINGGALGATYYATGIGSTFDILRVEVSSGYFQLLSHRNQTEIFVNAIYGKA